MSSVNGPMAEFNALYLRPIRQHWRIWVLPTIAFTAAATAFAILGPKFWLASQQLVVRNESLGAQISLGRFESSDMMKTVEETIHAVAKNRHVAAAVLRDIGPPEKYKQPQHWPTSEDIDDFLDCVSVTAPNGAIFGQTEVIHLNVKAEAPDRAIALTAALCNKLEQQLNELRAERSGGMKRDLEAAVELAEQDLNSATDELAKLEQSVGADLSELRTMDQQVAGGSGTLTMELGRARESLQESQRQAAAIELRRDHLTNIQDDPHAIVSVPTSVLASHATLAQLKTGLVTAELEMAKVLSKYDSSHPRVKRIQEEVDQVEQRLKQEVAIAIAEVAYDAQAMQSRINDLQRVTVALTERIERIARMRVDYNRLQAKVEQCKSDLAAASSQLAEVEANQRAAQASSIINRIGEPVVSTHPIGPSKKVVVAGGMLAGLALGIGLVFLLIPPETRERPALSSAIVPSLPFSGGDFTVTSRLAGNVADDSPTSAAVVDLDNDVAAISAGDLPTMMELQSSAPQTVVDVRRATESHPATVRPQRVAKSVRSTTSNSSLASSSLAVESVAEASTIPETSDASAPGEAPIRPRRSSEMESGDTEHDLVLQLHELREEMLRGKRPTDP